MFVFESMNSALHTRHSPRAVVNLKLLNDGHLVFNRAKVSFPTRSVVLNQSVSPKNFR